MYRLFNIQMDHHTAAVDSHLVMPALVAGIHVSPSRRLMRVDGRVKPGHDD
jgi:hypothetical protein